MKVAVTGSSGLIGTALVRALRGEGHAVLRLVRHPPAAEDEARWDPFGDVDTAALEGVDAVVNLSGAGLADRRWSEAYKREIRDSRVESTRTLARALASLERPPQVLVSASAIGYYAETGEETVDESGEPGTDFLAGVCREWEEATAPAADAGIRVVHTRTGLVLAREGGLLGRTLPLFRFGLGARLGGGRQWMSWIALPDQVAALRFLIDADLAGPVNLTTPEPATNAAYTRAVAAALHRPAPLAIPPIALRLLLGEFADEGALLTSKRIHPARLLAAGFTFRHPTLDNAIHAILD